MPTYIVTYHGGKSPASREEGAAHMKKWQEWEASLGKSLVNAGTPVTNGMAITQAGMKPLADSEKYMGFCFIEADNMEALHALCKTCPFLEIEGTLHAAEMRSLQPG